jgi:3-deoxy-7-phosphoheptulonate synthase
LPIVTEVIDPRDVSWVCEFADILQIGARNMQNFSLLKRGRPVSQTGFVKKRNVFYLKRVAKLC